MIGERQPDEEGGDPPSSPPTGVYGSPGSAAGTGASVTNINISTEQFSGSSFGQILVRLIDSQEARIGALGNDKKELQRLKADQEEEIRRLQDQLGRVRGLLPPLVSLFYSLDEDIRLKEAQRSALRNKIESALDGDDDLRAEFDRLDRYLGDLSTQQDLVAITLHETRVEELGVRNLLDVVRMRLLVFLGGKTEASPVMHEVSTATFALPGRSAEEEDLLAYANRVLDEANVILLEAHELLQRLELELYRTVVPDPDERGRSARLAELEREHDVMRKRLEESRKARQAQELKHEKELAQHKKKQHIAQPGRLVRNGPGGLLPAAGLFLLGVVIREAPRLAPLSDTQQVVFVGLALIFAGLPIVTLLKWSKSVDSPVQVVVAGLGAFCVVAGNFTWMVAIVFGVVALTSVVATKKAGLGFVATLVAGLVLSVAAPGVMWWSWGGFDWLARVL
jgi:hypothetical protein